MPSIIDILRLTPKTNCGKCGYPTCMAFSASLLSGMASPELCPYLDRKALEKAGFTPVTRSSSGQDTPETHLLTELKSRLIRIDLSRIAGNLGAVAIKDHATGKTSLKIAYLGRTVILSPEAVSSENNRELDPRDQILLYNYVFWGGKGPLSGEWVGLESFPNSISKVVTLKKYTEDRIAQAFKTAPEGLIRAARHIKGKPLRPCHADACLEIPVLPRVPLRVHFWQEEKEEGFPARVKILYDRRANEFLDLESLVFAAERMTETMLEK